MAVKREFGVKPQVGESDRDAKIRAKMEAIRSGTAGQVEFKPTEPSQGQKRKAHEQSGREDEDAKKLEKFLPALEMRINKLEEEGERVRIIGAPVAMEATPELRDLQLNAVKETERAVKAAQANLGAVRKEVEKKQREVSAFAPLARESASEELGKLQARLETVQEVLEQMKTVRKDLEMCTAAEKLFGELAGRLANVEMECEKAAMMAEPLVNASEISPQEINSQTIREAKDAMRLAQATLAPTHRLISGKIPSLKGAVKTKLQELETRAEKAEQLLKGAQTNIDEAHARASVGPILMQSHEKLQSVEVFMAKMSETEGPFLMGIETIPGEEGCELIGMMVEAAGEAEEAVAEALKYVSAKTVDVARLAEGAAKAARLELGKVKKTLDDKMKKVKSFQGETEKRRQVSMADLIHLRVEEADAAVQKLAPLRDSLDVAIGDEILEAVEAGKALELAAQAAVTLARKEFQDKQRNLQGKDAKAEVEKTKARIFALEAEVTKFRKHAKLLEEQVKVERSLGDVVENIKTIETDVEQVSELAQSWPTDTKPPAEDEAALRKLMNHVASCMKEVLKKKAKAQGLEQKELASIEKRLTGAGGKLDVVKGKANKAAKVEQSAQIKAAMEMIASAEGKVGEVGRATSSMTTPLSKFEELEQNAAAALQFVLDASRKLADIQEAGVVTEAKVELQRTQAKCKAMERRATDVSSSFRRKMEEAVSSAVGEVVDAFRKIANRKDDAVDVDALFAELGGEGGEISMDKLIDYFLARQPELFEEKVRFAIRRMAPYGLTKPILASALRKCVKVKRELTITDEFAIAGAKKVRKVDVGEFLEVVSDEKEDKELCVVRARCRCIRDGAIGWATIKSASGEIYLEKSSPPRIWVQNSVNLTKKMDDSTSIIRELVPGDVLDLIEGPKLENQSSGSRARGKACTDDSAGWLQIQDSAGKELAKVSSKIHKCLEAIAMTDVADFEKCTMVRRIEAGEALELLVADTVAPSEGGSRAKFRACRDNAEGWITTKGSQGTQYVRPATKHYVCLQAAPLLSGLGSESEVLRILMPGEAFAAFEEPRDVSGNDPKKYYKVRVAGDLAVGWVTRSLYEVNSWHQRYKVLKDVAMTQTLAVNEAAENVQVLRMLQANEFVKVAEPPIEDRSTGQLRVRCTATSDQVTGWATVRDGTSNISQVMMAPSLDKVASAAGKGGKGKGGGVKRVKEEPEEPSKYARR